METVGNHPLRSSWEDAVLIVQEWIFSDAAAEERNMHTCDHGSTGPASQLLVLTPHTKELYGVFPRKDVSSSQ